MSQQQSQQKDTASIEERAKRANVRDDQSDPTRPIRLIVAGSRDADQYGEFRTKLCSFLDYIGWERTEIVCGRSARGVDDMCYHFIRWDVQHPHVIFEADWDQFDKKAGPYRNEAMAIYASCAPEQGELFVLWDGSSRGTRSMINLARRYHLDSKVHIIEPWAREHFYRVY